MLRLKSTIGISIIIVFVTGGLLSLLFKGNIRTSSILLTEQDLAQNSLQSAVGLSNKERSELINVRDSLSRLLNQKQHELAKLQCEVSDFSCLGYNELMLYVLVNIFQSCRNLFTKLSSDSSSDENNNEDVPGLNLRLCHFKLEYMYV